MKLLAIRGRNLASLAGDFALALDVPPLGDTGLFAITGPTGAGKSTLLDAVCLALFDAAPRLGQGRGVPIGRGDEDEADRLSSQDVRGLLRRGAGSGYAEVDFIGRDKNLYRARWSVWRARERPDGRFQPQEMALQRLDSGQVLGRTKSETLSLIEDRLGLSYAQFLRSALLAQGDFAAFLRADARERAELLERMTGTEIYGRLSMGAFARAKTAQAELDALIEQARLITALDDNARAALEAEEALCVQAEQHARAELLTLERARDHYHTQTRLRAAVAQARADCAVAEQRWQACQSTIAELEAIAAVAPLRPLAATADERAAQHQRTQRELCQAEATYHSATASEATAVAAVERAAVQQAQAQAEYEHVTPMLAQAAHLDAELASFAQRLVEIETMCREAQHAVDAARQQTQRLEHRLGRLDRQRSETLEWLRCHAEVQPLAREWPRWREHLDRCVRAATEAAQADGHAVLLDAECERLHAQHDTTAQQVTAREQRFVHALERCQDAEQAARAALDAPLDVEREAASAGQRIVVELEHLGEQARAAAAMHEQELHALRAAQERARELNARADVSASQQHAQRALLQAAEAELEHLRILTELARYRSALHPGEPCPLCGATTHPHPVSLDDAQARPSLAALTARVAQLRARLGGLEQHEIAARAQADAEQHHISHARERRDRAAEQLAQLGLRYRELCEELSRASQADALALPELPRDPLDPAAEPARKAALVHLLGRLDGVRNREHQRRQLRSKAEQARQALEDERQRLDQLRRVLAENAQALTAARHAQADNQRLVLQARADHDEALRELLPAFAARPLFLAAGVRADPSAFRERSTVEVKEWQTREQLRESTQEKINRLSAELEAERARAAERELDLARRYAEHKHLAAQRARVAKQRQQVLGGRSVTFVRIALELVRSQTQAASEQARQVATEAARNAAAAAARRESSRSAYHEHQQALVMADHALAEALAEQQISSARLADLLAVDDQRLDERRAGVAAAREQRSRAQTILGERERELQRHDDAVTPAVAEAELDARLADATQYAALAVRRLAEASGRLHADTTARRRRAALEPEIERRREDNARWQTLAELIGSADGKKFRVFAQSLTLETLLEHANVHLSDLARRYRLMRVPGHDLDLQVVDLEMGREVRSTSSLSGGESFLVSLALALGLSSLAARDTEVDTLFIDEGFGTLDAATLESALATLDALQAGGRQIGLISHVNGLAERIGVQVQVVPQGGGRSRVVVVRS